MLQGGVCGVHLLARRAIFVVEVSNRHCQHGVFSVLVVIHRKYCMYHDAKGHKENAAKHVEIDRGCVRKWRQDVCDDELKRYRGPARTQ